MRYLPDLLAKLWPPAPLPPAVPMDHNEADAVSDPISCELDAAVDAHARAATFAQDNYARRVRDTIDELLERIGPQR